MLPFLITSGNTYYYYYYDYYYYYCYYYYYIYIYIYPRIGTPLTIRQVGKRLAGRWKKYIYIYISAGWRSWSGATRSSSSARAWRSESARWFRICLLLLHYYCLFIIIIIIIIIMLPHLVLFLRQSVALGEGQMG